MRFNLKLFSGIIFLALIVGCASPYRTMNPVNHEFNARIETEKLIMEYNPDILELTNNHKQVKKAKKKELNFAITEFVNISNDTLDLSNDIKFISLNEEIQPLSVEKSFELLKQHPASYYLSLLSFSITIGSGGGTAFFGISPISLIYAVPNSIIAGKANKKMKEEFYNFDFYNTNLLPSDTAYVFLCYKGVNNTEFSILSIQGDSVSNKIKLSQSKSFSIDSVLFFEIEKDSSYESYLNTLTKALESNKYVSEVRSYREKYKNGNVKYVGIKAKHELGVNSDYFYKLGTWKYFYNNGQIKEYIDYNMTEDKSGVYKYYNEDGTLQIDKRYFHGRENVCKDCIMSYNKDSKKDIIELNDGKIIECVIIDSDSENINVKLDSSTITKIKKKEITKIVYGKLGATAVH